MRNDNETKTGKLLRIQRDAAFSSSPNLHDENGWEQKLFLVCDEPANRTYYEGHTSGWWNLMEVATGIKVEGCGLADGWWLLREEDDEENNFWMEVEL